jgi:DNA-binding SARP family transcriptional activator
VLCLGGTRTAGAERAARRLIERAPLSEIGYRLLMDVLARRGDSAAALGVYEQLRRVLRRSSASDPGPDARRLHKRLLHATDDS